MRIKAAAKRTSLTPRSRISFQWNSRVKYSGANLMKEAHPPERTPSMVWVLQRRGFNSFLLFVTQDDIC